MGFGGSWIRAALVSAWASVLVNGSPIDEFDIHRGLCQGDPLSPLLFILVIEGLHVSLIQAKENRVFSGFAVGSFPVHISHLFYADDAVFICDWDLEYVIRIL